LFFKKAKIILGNTARHSHTRGAKGPRQNIVQKSIQSPQRQTEEKQKKRKQIHKKQAKIHALSKLQDSDATIDYQNRK